MALWICTLLLIGSAQVALGQLETAIPYEQLQKRGICVRHGGRDNYCYSSLNQILEHELNEVRKGEYAGAAGVMALLPTIGALLGAPTNEIWRLMAMVPFGGALAMAMSFGGAILPVNVKDYESDFMKQQIDTRRPKGPNRIASDLSYFKETDHSHNEMVERGGRLMEQVEKRLKSTERKEIPTKYIWSGLIGMLVLLLGAHGSMAIVEQGTILPWWSLKQLETLQAGTLKIIGSPERARSHNTLYVMVSVQEQRATTWKVTLRACSKLSSIGVFITGTAMLASAQLLSIAMATFALTLVLAAGVFGRTIAGWIVAGIEQVEPMMHFVARTEKEAYYVIARLLNFELERDDDHVENGGVDPRKIQVEIRGHIFVSRCRIMRRSRLPSMLLGILAPTFDVSKTMDLPSTSYEVPNEHSGLTSSLVLDGEEHLKSPHITTNT
ncbi:hypothetical protein DDE82_008225 [Stemphylium lycopersici]|nr:hypothetical protein DDE82_008225 [Stemphylium lycopersici]